MKPNILTPEGFKKYLDDNKHALNMRHAGEFIQDMKDVFQKKEQSIGDQTSFPTLRGKLGFRAGEVTVWAGYNGHGKSMFLGQVMMDMITSHQKAVCFASMEMKPGRNLGRMIRQYLKTSVPTDAEIEGFAEAIQDHCWFYDVLGVVQTREMVAAIKHAAIDLGVKHFVVDSLMKCGIDEDDHNGTKRFVDQLCTVARDTGIHIHLVAHSKKNKDESVPPGKMDVRGTGTITDQVDNVITIWRNKDLNRPQGEDAMMIVDKQRNGEWEGVVSFRYCTTSQSYSETFQVGF